MGAGHFGHKTIRHRDTSAPQNWCRSLQPITGGAVYHRKCPGSKWTGFSSITTLVSKCLVPRFWCRSVLMPVSKCPRVSWCRSVLWPKCPVTRAILLLTWIDSRPAALHNFVKWQLIGTSTLHKHSTLCSHPLPALANSWTCSAAWHCSSIGRYS